jgi:hypothetical protein
MFETILGRCNASAVLSEGIQPETRELRASVFDRWIINAATRLP